MCNYPFKLLAALALTAGLGVADAAPNYLLKQATPGMTGVEATPSIPKTYAKLDPTRKSGTGVMTDYSLSAGSVFYVQSNIAQTGFYYEGHINSYYGGVGIGTPTLALLFDSGGAVWLNASRRYTWSRQPTNNDVIAWTWDGVVASLYMNNQKVYTTSPGDLPAGTQRALLYSNGGSVDANFGATPFAYGVPAGAPAGLYQ